jgi:hypothetical protein
MIFNDDLADWEVMKYHCKHVRSFQDWNGLTRLHEIITTAKWMNGRESRQGNIGKGEYAATLRYRPSPPIQRTPSLTCSELAVRARAATKPPSASTPSSTSTLTPEEAGALVLYKGPKGPPHRRTISEVTPRAERDQEATERDADVQRIIDRANAPRTSGRSNKGKRKGY